MVCSMKLLLMIAVMNVFCMCAGDGKSSQLEKRSYKPEMKDWDPCLLARLAISKSQRKVVKQEKKEENRAGAAVKERTVTEELEEITGTSSEGFKCLAVRLHRTTSQGETDMYDTFLTRQECSIGCSQIQ